MIVGIPRNTVTLSILGTFFTLAGFGALAQSHIFGSLILFGAGAIFLATAVKGGPKAST